MIVSPVRGLLARALFALLLGAPLSAFAARVPIADHENPLWRQQHGLPLEYQEDAPMPPAPPGLRTTRASSTITFGPYASYQVNVNGFGNDIVNDAANEPSLAVNPVDHNKMVIGWRQFDNIASNFREAGVGYSTNGGLTWTAGKLQAGVFRSDPVLATDNGGNIYYNSLTTYYGPLSTQVFRSYTGGATWEAGVFADGGDKQWMYMDPDFENLYQAWSVASNNYAPNTFNKSVDQGDTYSPPSAIPGSPIWGTLTMDTAYRLFVVGWAVNDSGYLTDIVVSRSNDAYLHDSDPPHFTTVPVNLGGYVSLGGPNPAGLLGQLWICVDRTSGPRAGWVYVLASVETPTDPMDVMFIRSTDHGQTWSAPVRVNDDPAGNTRKFQWFGTMSVAPSGRIDAVWNDTRASADSTISALYYSYSANGGTTWSPNVQVTPTWSSVIGWPNQQKIGDYYTTTSDDAGVDVAYAATFNGGEDIYYLRIPNTVTGVGNPQAATPLRLANAPNPFARGTTIRFDAPAAGGTVRLEIFDLAGHRVATLIDGFRTGAGQSIEWDGRRSNGRDAAPGVYLCRLASAGSIETRKILRIR
jgi:hypothetical protein